MHHQFMQPSGTKLDRKIKQMFGVKKKITCSKYSQHNAFDSFGVSINVILCGSKRLGNLAEVQIKLVFRSHCVLQTIIVTHNKQIHLVLNISLQSNAKLLFSC